MTAAPTTAVSLAVVDYGAGNMVSITHALDQLGARVRLARRPADLRETAGVVVPGVGASGPAMTRLRRSGMADALRERVSEGAVFLGICLGMQLLFDRSDEDGSTGLGWLEGPVALVPDAPRLPHIGWNQVDAAPTGLFAGIEPGTPFYFVHSFAPRPADERVVTGYTEHGGRFASAVASGRMLGVQFHPEKSGAAGLQLLRNFVTMVAEASAGAPIPGVVTPGAATPGTTAPGAATAAGVPTSGTAAPGAVTAAPSSSIAKAGTTASGAITAAAPSSSIAKAGTVTPQPR